MRPANDPDSDWFRKRQMGKRQSTKTAALGGRLLIAAAMMAAAAFLVWGFLTGRNDAAVEGEREQPMQAPLRVASKNGQQVITIDAETQERSGIETKVLPPTPYREQVRAYGVVLDVARLTALSNSLVSAKTQVQTAEAKLAMSRPAFERAKKLYDDQQAVSQAQLQSAQAAFATDEAGLAAAQAQVRTLTATAYQEWGSVLGKSLVEESPVITRLIERLDFLLQITLPPGVLIPAPPPTASIEIGHGKRTAITFVSPATRMDPKIQGLSFFYVASAESGLLPGMNVLAFLPTGKTVDGVSVPASAIVWWQDKAWVYRRAGPETFTRNEIATDLPAEGGAYMVKDIPPDAEIVTGGAQLLLSEEFRAQIQVEDKQ
jgi:hypothetical protein